MHTAASIERRLRALGDPERARVSQRFFRTRPGEYGAGDRFLGIRVPVLRALAREHQGLDLGQAEALLQSSWHEARLLALLILVRQFSRSDGGTQAEIYRLYLRNTRRINNWDLVDSSAEQIMGAYLRERSRAPLTRLARSSDLWERRIAILATFHFIKRGEHAETLRIARLLLHDRHDLIHKAVGWMLRETGKRDRAAEEAFLRAHAHEMPRTMLRYAIERFPEPLRRRYLAATLPS